MIAPTLLFSLLLSPVFSGEPLKSKSAHALTTEIKNGVLLGDLKAGFHFNQKAPNQIDGSTKIKPSKISAQHLEIPLPKVLPSPARASLYVCDDALTFCEVHHVDLDAKSQSEEKSPVSPAANAAPKSNKPDTHGFFPGNLPDHLAQAKQNKKLLLLDFSARWCPGCIRLESEIFSRKEFISAAKDLIKVKVDVDLFENFEISKKYAIQGIPALVLLTSDGEEINRSTDYQPLDRILAFIQDAQGDSRSLTQLQSQAKPEDLRKLGLRLYYSERFDEAVSALSQISPAPPELRQARVQAASRKNSRAKSPSSETELRSTLQTTLKEESDTFRALQWRAQLAEIQEKDPQSRSENVAAAKTLTETLLGKPDLLKNSVALESMGEFTGIERFLVALTWAELLDSIKAPETELLTAWKSAERIGRESMDQLKKPGPALRFLIVLMEAKNFADAELWSAKIIREQPNNKDLLRRRLRILVALNKFPEAIRVGEESLKHAEGRMEFLVIENLAKAYWGAEKKTEAKALLSAALTRPELSLPKLKEDKDRLQAQFDSYKK